jgi:RNA polymerase sigma factor (sigma-70 family)
LADWYSVEYEPLLRFAYFLTHDQDAAQDLVQETFVRLYRSASKVDPLGLPAYARRTIVNLSRSAHRRRLLELRAITRIRPERPRAASPEDAHDMKRRILDLPAGMRACLALRYYEDMPDAQIAETLGLSVAAVRKQIERGTKRLRDDLVPRSEA